MAEARAMTNLIGNGVATVVIARWENELDREKANAVLNEINAEQIASTPATPTSPEAPLRDPESA
jgi:aerobic C4-dicarboxylate transport protein